MRNTLVIIRHVVVLKSCAGVAVAEVTAVSSANWPAANARSSSSSGGQCLAASESTVVAEKFSAARCALLALAFAALEAQKFAAIRCENASAPKFVCVILTLSYWRGDVLTTITTTTTVNHFIIIIIASYSFDIPLIYIFKFASGSRRDSPNLTHRLVS